MRARQAVTCMMPMEGPGEGRHLLDKLLLLGSELALGCIKQGNLAHRVAHVSSSQDATRDGQRCSSHHHPPADLKEQLGEWQDVRVAPALCVKGVWTWLPPILPLTK